MLLVLSSKVVIDRWIRVCQGVIMKMKNNKRISLVGTIILGLFLYVAFPVGLYAEVLTDTNAAFTSVPINLTGNDVTPLVMINASRDHQLSYKAYNDYSDLNNDGTPETTYVDSIEYYGYFDSAKCYTYDTSDD